MPSLKLIYLNMGAFLLTMTHLGSTYPLKRIWNQDLRRMEFFYQKNSRGREYTHQFQLAEGQRSSAIEWSFYPLNTVAGNRNQVSGIG